MAADTNISATEWLKIRNAVAHQIEQKTTSKATEKIAEHLLLLGWIDVDAVRAYLSPKPSPTELDENNEGDE